MSLYERLMDWKRTADHLDRDIEDYKIKIKECKRLRDKALKYYEAFKKRIEEEEKNESSAL